MSILRDTFKGILSLIIGNIILLLMYYLFNLPTLPAITIYAFSYLLLEKFNCTNKYVYIIFLILLGICGVSLYGFQIYSMIKYYPEYGNILAIIFESMTLLAIFGAVNFHLLMFKKEIKV